MENVFNVNDYFTENFGLGIKPSVPKMNVKMLVIGVIILIAGIALGIVVHMAIMLLSAIGVVLIIIPIIKNNAARKKANEWQKNFNERYQKWDGELDKFYNKTVSSMNVKQTAMTKIGIDEEDVKEVAPFSIHGQTYDGWYRFGADGNIRTDDREITWLFFSKDQVYLYTVSFSLTGKTRKIENTQEFFYSDIVSVSTGSVSKTLNTKKSAGGSKEETIEAEEFRLVVPGDKISFAFTSNNEISRSVQAMKNKIREKKNR